LNGLQGRLRRGDCDLFRNDRQHAVHGLDDASFRERAGSIRRRLRAFPSCIGRVGRKIAEQPEGSLEHDSDGEHSVVERDV